MEPFDLAELQTLPLPRCTVDDFSLNGLPQGTAEAYVARFLAPRLLDAKDVTVSCVGCGETLLHDGMLGAIFGQTFTWGLANGEGYCSTCGYPVRMYHRFPQGSVAFPLQYHPDELERRSA